MLLFVVVIKWRDITLGSNVYRSPLFESWNGAGYWNIIDENSTEGWVSVNISDKIIFASFIILFSHQFKQASQLQMLSIRISELF